MLVQIVVNRLAVSKKDGLPWLVNLIANALLRPFMLEQLELIDGNGERLSNNVTVMLLCDAAHCKNEQERRTLS